MSHHVEHSNKVGSQPGYVTPNSQSGRLCSGSVDCDKEGTSRQIVHLMRYGARKFGWANVPAT